MKFNNYSCCFFNSRYQRNTLVLFLIFLQGYAYSQTEQAWVYLTEKNIDLLGDPTALLTQKALDRKEKYAIEIDERDIPIDQSYVESLKSELGITYITQSKWFNAVYVEGTAEAVSNLTNLEFVDRIFFMNRSLNAPAFAIANEQPVKKAKKFTSNKFDFYNDQISKIEAAKTKEVRVTNKSKKEVAQFTEFNYGETEEQLSQINLIELHKENYTGKGMTIAVIDSGFTNVDEIEGFDRARANNQILGGYNFPDRSSDVYGIGSHGTWVLSTMLGFIQDVYVGSAPDAKYYLFRTEIGDKESPEEEAFWVAAAERADSLGVDVINTSLGYQGFDEAKYDYDDSQLDGVTAFISQGANIALEKGMIPVTSSGNSGTNPVAAPADSFGAFVIGAVQRDGNIAGFSSFGPTSDGRRKPDVMANGADPAVIHTDGTIRKLSGTSFSSPIMAGSVACLWQAFPEKTPTEIMDLIRSTASMSETPDDKFGYGIANFGRALNPDTLTTIDSSEQSTLDLNQIVSISNTYLEVNEVLKSAEKMVYDMQGRLLLSSNANTTSLKIDNLANGIYIFKSNMNTEAKLFIKK